MGKGLHYLGEDEYLAAWGSEGDHFNNYDYSDWDYGYGEFNYMNNQLMSLECGIAQTEKHETQNISSTMTNKTAPGKRDPLRGVEMSKPVSTHNKYIVLIEEDQDSDSDDDDNRHVTNRQRIGKPYNPNRRQRRKANMERVHAINNCTIGDHDAQVSYMECECRESYTPTHYMECEICNTSYWRAITNATTTTTGEFEMDDNECMNVEVNDSTNVGGNAFCYKGFPQSGTKHGIVQALRDGKDVRDCSDVCPKACCNDDKSCIGEHKVCQHVGNGGRSGAYTYMCGGNVCCNGATGLLGHCPNGVWAPARLSRGSQNQQEGPLVRMMRRIELCNCTHTHTTTHDHNQHDHDNLAQANNYANDHVGTPPSVPGSKHLHCIPRVDHHVWGPSADKSWNSSQPPWAHNSPDGGPRTGPPPPEIEYTS